MAGSRAHIFKGGAIGGRTEQLNGLAAMQASIASSLLRQAPALLAGGVLLVVSACASEPAQIGTPQYALERLFSTGPARSMDQLLARQQPLAARSAATETPAAAADITSPAITTAPAATAPVTAGVTIIEMNEWPLYTTPAGVLSYYPPYAYAYPRPRLAPLRPAYRPGYYGMRGPYGYGPERCFGNCGGLSLSVGTGNTRLRLNAGSSSVSTSTIIVQPPLP